MSRKANRKSQKSFPFAKMAEKHRGVPIHFKLNTIFTCLKVKVFPSKSIPNIKLHHTKKIKIFLVIFEDKTNLN